MAIMCERARDNRCKEILSRGKNRSGNGTRIFENALYRTGKLLRRGAETQGMQADIQSSKLEITPT